MRTLGLFILLGIASTGTGSAQSRTSVRLRKVAPSTAPERIVYEVFTAEVLAHDRHSNDRALPEGRRKEIATRLQSLLGVSDADYATLKGIAARLHVQLDDNAKQGDAVLRNPALTTTQRAASIATLRDARNAAVDEAVRQWRARVGIRFRWIDDKIRAHVAPGLRISDGPPSGGRI